MIRPGSQISLVVAPCCFRGQPGASGRRGQPLALAGLLPNNPVAPRHCWRTGQVLPQLQGRVLCMCRTSKTAQPCRKSLVAETLRGAPYAQSHPRFPHGSGRQATEERKGVLEGGAMPGAPGWVSAGDSEPFAAHTHQHPAPSLRAAGHEWQKGAGRRGVARAHPKGSWISPHPHPHPPAPGTEDSSLA